MMTHLNRRKFIKSTTAISAATFLSPSIAFGSKANSAIMGRDAATSNELLSWDETYFSNSKLDPKLNMSQFNR